MSTTEEIREARKAAGLSQQQLASLAGLPQATVSAVERAGVLSLQLKKALLEWELDLLNSNEEATK